MSAETVSKVDGRHEIGYRDLKAEDYLSEVIHCHLDDMLTVARRLLGSPDLAWDAVQETLLTLWLESEAPESLRGWLLRTVKNRSLHLLRTGRRRLYQETACACLRCLVSQEDAARRLEDREFVERVWTSVQELPEGFRLVFELREFMAMDYAAIAEELDVSVGTVRSRLHRSRRLIREYLKGN